MRHNRIAITVQYGCVSLRMRFFSQNFGTIKRILPGSSSPSHREGPGIEVGFFSAAPGVGKEPGYEVGQYSDKTFSLYNMKNGRL